MLLRLRYTSGEIVTIPVDKWAECRGDGIDYVDLIDDAGDASRVQGQSVYWVYPEGDAWVVGGGTVGHPEIVEVVVPDHESRRPWHMPDLAHGQVKLGWWLPEGGD